MLGNFISFFLGMLVCVLILAFFGGKGGEEE